MIRVLDSAGSTLVEWGRQQQQHNQLCQDKTTSSGVDVGRLNDTGDIINCVKIKRLQAVLTLEDLMTLVT